MQDSQNAEMSFIDHVEELRWHIIRAVIAVLIFTIIAFSFMDFIFHHILLGPVRPDFWTYQQLCKLGDGLCIKEINFRMQNRTMAGQFNMHIVAAFVSGIVIAFPYIFWEFWSFIKPGLHPTERKYASGAVLFVTTLFTLGILFGYYMVTPLSVNFLINYQLDPSIENIIDISSYITFVCMLVIGSGLMFQLPVIIYILTRIGIVGPVFLRKFRKHAIIGIFIVAAIVTPSPDLITQSIVAVPLIILYELSIFISAAVASRKAKGTY
jgi:sec-independent protein translocase protein TatC